MEGMLLSVRYIFLGVFILLASGCSLWQPKVDIAQTTIDVAAGANDNAPIAVDIVAVREAALLERLQALSAGQWFNAREQLRRDYPDGFRVWSLELVPGSRYQSGENPLQGAPASGVLLFARYRSEGDHRLRLDHIAALCLRLMADEVELCQQGREDE